MQSIAFRISQCSIIAPFHKINFFGESTSVYNLDRIILHESTSVIRPVRKLEKPVFPETEYQLRKLRICQLGRFYNLSQTTPSTRNYL